MRIIQYYMTVFALILSFMANAQDNNGSMQQAIDKAKSDLLEILNTGKDFNFGVDATQLRDARSSSPIAYHKVDFQKLLTHEVDSLNMSIDPLLLKSEKSVVAFVNGNNVVATVTISTNKEGQYTAGELLNQQYTSELNMLPTAIKQRSFNGISIIEVRNLRATIYQIDGKMYTSYKGRSLRQEQDPMLFIEALNTDARDFQDRYGEILKKQKLVD